MRSTGFIWLAFALLGASGCGGGGSSSDSPPVPVDTTAPSITLNGAADIAHEQGTDFVDPGAQANDDGVLSDVFSTDEVGADAGTYTLDYSASDSAGNVARVSRTVIVSDTTPPVITLNGPSALTIIEGDAFVDAGATALDRVDGEVAVVVTGAVAESPGVYELTYTATDAALNSASVGRNVEVQAAGDEERELSVLFGGIIGPDWDIGLSAFDEAIDFADCVNDNGAACPSISWEFITDSVRGDVLQITHGSSGELAGVFIASTAGVNISSFAQGALSFDVKIVSGDGRLTAKLDCIFPCTSGDQNLADFSGGDWQTVTLSVAQLVTGGLDLTRVNTGIVIWATGATNTVFQVDNIKFTGGFDGPVDPGGGGYAGPFELLPFGAGNVSDTINPGSVRCVEDFGFWAYNAGVVEPAVAGCNVSTGIPVGSPAPIFPKLIGPALQAKVPTHRWWGSIPFLGEMNVGDPNDAAYITPDPMIARISDRGARISGLPAGLGASSQGFGFPIPDPFSEVFDGLAIGNTDYANLQVSLSDHSDGSVTALWHVNGETVMHATFVHGSPYAYFTVLQGNLQVRTLRSDGPEKGIFFNENNSLGVWTNVAGVYNHFLITGEGETTFSNVASNAMTVNNAAGELTVALIPIKNQTPTTELINAVAALARNVVASVTVDYQVDRTTNSVAITHQYLDQQGLAIETYAGLMPMHWKNQVTSVAPEFSIRSARGVIQFQATDSFTYSLPAIGVLPALPTLPGTFDLNQFSALVREFIDAGPPSWNSQTNTYWAGKNYGKVADLIAIADASGLETEADQLLAWLKIELADWFTANTNGSLDEVKYFVYDDRWDTLLGLEEAFGSHQQLNDHHFHYGYFIRAAAEICRQDVQWCSETQYGPMIELLIRDYAAGRDDPLFPYLRHFDPANGFSWASGKVNFVRGNNNESTSEAANAYGAMVLYGLITQQDDIVDRGMYLHASTAAAYWEYWNNLDGFNQLSAETDNFPPGYSRITTSIIWGDGSAFATFFSGAFAHILGIQGLPSNPLILHVGQYPDYLADYVALGLSESSNQRPSGLPNDQWRDLWWNLWALQDPDAAIADYESVGSYIPEAGETKAHTFHWLYTFQALGQMITGTGDLTADYPAAMAFNKSGVVTYVVYNFDASPRRVTFSNGQVVDAAPLGFTWVTN